MDLNIQKFGGIRQTSPVADLVSTNSISAVVCRNAELQYTEKSNTVGVFSVMGNAAVASCDYEIVGQWSVELYYEIKAFTAEVRAFFYTV